MAKAIAMARGLPLIGVNHLEAHICANWLENGKAVEFPCLCLIVSGGHSDLILMKGQTRFEKLGQTRDDAAGEALDKAARILGLGYPGGAAIEQAAEKGAPLWSFPRAWLKGSCDFSFSGLKTSLWHLTQKGQVSVADTAASFQEAIVDVLVTKTVEVASDLGVKSILLSGGVAANRMLRERFAARSLLPVFVPSPILCTDNAAMVAACGYYRFQAGEFSGYDLDVVPGLSLG